MPIFWSKVDVTFHLGLFLASHTYISRHLSPLLAISSSPTNKGPYVERVWFLDVKFWSWAVDIIQYAEVYSESAEQNRASAERRPAKKSSAHLTNPRFLFAVRKFIVVCRNNRAILGTCLEKNPSCYIPSSQIQLRESPFPDKGSETILTQAKDCVIRQHNNALECKERSRLYSLPNFRLLLLLRHSQFPTRSSKQSICSPRNMDSTASARSPYTPDRRMTLLLVLWSNL